MVLGLLGAATLFGVAPSHAQSEERPEVKIGREQYTVAQAATGKSGIIIMGQVIGTASTEAKYGRKFGFVLQDFATQPAKVVVYLNSSVPPMGKPIWVRGELLNVPVRGSGNETHRLFLAEGAKEGLPPEAGGSAAPQSGGSAPSLMDNKLLLLALAALMLGGATLFIGLLQSSRKKKPEATNNAFDDPLARKETFMAEDYSGMQRGGQAPPLQGGQGGGFSGPQGGFGQSAGGFSGGFTPGPGGYQGDTGGGPPLVPDTGPNYGAYGQGEVGGGETLFDEKVVYASSEGSETVFDRGETMASLPAYFEVVSGSKEEVGARKHLLSVGGRMAFEIARAANNQDLIANFIPIKSDMVSRKSENQGQVIYDPNRNTYLVKNFADPAQRKNPIKIGGLAMQPNEERVLAEGDLVQVGDVTLRFHRES